MTEAASALRSSAPLHRFRLSVYWEDTDAAGIVYYANYLKFIERARSDLVARAGVDQAALMQQHGLIFPVRRCEIDYLLPARLGDELTVETALRRVGGASLDLQQDIHGGRGQVACASVRLACVDRDGRPHRIPPDIAIRLREYEINAGGR